MTSELRSELLKQRSTRTNLGLLGSMVGLVLLVVMLHGLNLPVANLTRRSIQVGDVFGRSALLGMLFAGLVGALSMTGEFRHGTIRPTFLVTPRRGRIVAAKVCASMLGGLALGLMATVVAAGVGSAVLLARGVTLQLDATDYVLLIGGGAVAAALWAAIGVGIGALIRHQVPSTVGISAWLLFVEGLLVGDAGAVGSVGRYLPGALGNAASGQVPLIAPALAVLLLALYAAALATVGWRATSRRDVA
ncbi:MAG: ABC transporter permease [Candidatus Dormibacteria bacterium]